MMSWVPSAWGVELCPDALVQENSWMRAPFAVLFPLTDMHLPGDWSVLPVRLHCWLVPPEQVHSWILAPSAELEPLT